MYDYRLKHFSNKELRGFTLLEIMLVLAIIVIFLGFGTAMIINMAKERKLREASGELASFARTARHNALTEEGVFEIELNATGYSLRRQKEIDEKADSKDPETAFKKIIYKLSKSIVFEYKPWMNQTWAIPNKAVWVFYENGLCEPLSFRFSDGDNFIMQSYSPLTAAVREETYQFE